MKCRIGNWLIETDQHNWMLTREEKSIAQKGARFVKKGDVVTSKTTTYHRTFGQMAEKIINEDAKGAEDLDELRNMFSLAIENVEEYIQQNTK